MPAGDTPLTACAESIRWRSPRLGPFPDRCHFFGARHAKRLRRVNLRQQHFRRQLLLLRKRGVQPRNNRLLDFRSREAFASRSKLCQIERARITPALFQMQFKQRRANFSSPGKSTKKISSNRPLRIISGGRTVMLFDVAAKKTPLSRSCIHVNRVANSRCDNPASASPLEPAEANAFSISSIHSTIGESFCASSSALCSFFSLSPTNLSYNAPASSRASSNPHSPATARAARLFPHPCTPVINIPFGGTSPNR